MQVAEPRPAAGDAGDSGGTGGAGTGLLDLLPGALAAVSVAVIASIAGSRIPLVGGPVLAIVIGLVISTVRPPVSRLKPGLHFTGRQVLQGSIVVLGFGLSLREVGRIGVSSLPVLAGTLSSALLVAWVAGRALGLRRDVTTLVGVGTAICGASAIAAADAVIDADETDVSYSITTIFLFNVIAVLSYPALGHLLGMSQHTFGMFAGTAVNDTSSVVAAATVYGHQAVPYAVVVKLTRVLAIVPICVGLSVLRRRERPVGIAGRQSGLWERARKAVPLFVVGFLAAAGVDSLGVIPSGVHRDLSDLATWMITAALAAIGLSSRLSRIRTAGPRPLMLGAILWLTVGAASLGLQVATGGL